MDTDETSLSYLPARRVCKAVLFSCRLGGLLHGGYAARSALRPEVSTAILGHIARMKL